MFSSNLLLTKSVIYFLAFLFLYVVIYDMNTYNLTEKEITKLHRLLNHLIFYTHTHTHARREREKRRGMRERERERNIQLQILFNVSKNFL